MTFILFCWFGALENILAEEHEDLKPRAGFPSAGFNVQSVNLLGCLIFIPHL